MEDVILGGRVVNRHPLRRKLGGETEVTIATARFIGGIHWKVVSIALPRGGSGLSFVSDDLIEPSIVPDIVAYSEQTCEYLFIESKPRFSPADVEKLLKVTRGCYSHSIYSILKCQTTSILTGIAFTGQVPVMDFALLGIDYVFHLDGQGKIGILYGLLD